MTANYCTHSRHSGGPYLGGPNIDLSPELLGGEKVDANFHKILGDSVKHGGLYIMDPCLSAYHAYITSKKSYGKLIGSLLGGTISNT